MIELLVRRFIAYMYQAGYLSAILQLVDFFFHSVAAPFGQQPEANVPVRNCAQNAANICQIVPQSPTSEPTYVPLPTSA
jgi:hypothetical protein